MNYRFLCLLTTVAAALSYGQTGRATLTGIVTDPTGAVVANVPVKAVQVDTGTTVIGVTTETGNYTIAQMPIGPYEVTVEQPGFKKFKRPG